MAGLYVDVIGNRFEIDKDGTVGAAITSAGIITVLTATEIQNLNTESDTGSTPAAGTNGFLALIFPELRNLVGAFVASQSGQSVTIQYSTDTTNGFDGTWATYLGAGVRPTTTRPAYRTGIESANASGVKALRVQFTTGTASLRSFHVYGSWAAASPDKLELWHPTLDQPLSATPAALDFGDKGRGSTTDLQFRLKNMSATLTANTITVSSEALTDATSPTVISGISFSYDGGGYANTASITSLAPSTISSGVCTVRNAIPLTVSPGLWSQRIIASAASWV